MQLISRRFKIESAFRNGDYRKANDLLNNLIDIIFSESGQWEFNK